MEKLIRRSRPFLFLLLALMLSCSGFPLKERGPGGVYHRVKRGETFLAIARAYDTDIQTLAEANNIIDPSRIKTDSVIFIPRAQAVVDEIEIISSSSKKVVQAPPGKSAGKDASVHDKGSLSPKPDKINKIEQRDAKKPVAAPGLREETIKEAPVNREPARKTDDDNRLKTANEGIDKDKQEKLHFSRNIFIWPVKGTVVSFFGVQPNGMFFNGIRIAAPVDSAVFAAADGTVIHSEFLKYYGETIIVQHKGDYATVYANLGVRAVGLNARVKKGERIGFTGKDAFPPNDAHLYFEIRHKNKARNPLFFLP